MRYFRISMMCVLAVLLVNQTIYVSSTYQVAKYYEKIPHDIEALKNNFNILSENKDELVFSTVDGQTAIVLSREDLYALAYSSEAFANQDYLFGLLGMRAWEMRIITLALGFFCCSVFVRNYLRRTRAMAATSKFHDIVFSAKIRMLGRAPKEMSQEQQRDYLESLKLICHYVGACRELTERLNAEKIDVFHPISVVVRNLELLNYSLEELGVEPLDPQKSKLTEIGQQQAKLVEDREEFLREERRLRSEIKSQVRAEVDDTLAQERSQLEDSANRANRASERLSSKQQQLQLTKAELDKVRTQAQAAKEQSEIDRRQAQQLRDEATSLQEEITKAQTANEELLRRLEAGFDFCADKLLERCLEDSAFLAKMQEILVPALQE